MGTTGREIGDDLVPWGAIINDVICGQQVAPEQHLPITGLKRRTATAKMDRAKSRLDHTQDKSKCLQYASALFRKHPTGQSHQEDRSGVPQRRSDRKAPQIGSTLWLAEQP